jgi:hypothetical protein
MTLLDLPGTLAVRPLTIAQRLAVGAKVPPELLLRLQYLHRRQWELEDDSRSVEATSEQIAAVKGLIDASNTERHRMIDAIDAAVGGSLTGPGRLYSETVGELCDRLLILDLKYQALTNGGPARPTARTHIEGLCSYLSAVVSQLLDDLAAGTAVLPPRFGMKIYVQPDQPVHV